MLICRWHALSFLASNWTLILTILLIDIILVSTIILQSILSKILFYSWSKTVLNLSCCFIWWNHLVWINAPSEIFQKVLVIHLDDSIEVCQSIFFITFIIFFYHFSDLIVSNQICIFNINYRFRTLSFSILCRLITWSWLWSLRLLMRWLGSFFFLFFFVFPSVSIADVKYFSYWLWKGRCRWVNLIIYHTLFIFIILILILKLNRQLLEYILVIWFECIRVGLSILILIESYQIDCIQKFLVFWNWAYFISIKI